LDISVHRQPSTVYSIASLLHHWLKRLAVRELKRMIERERPNIIHVKGRIICEAFAVLPSDRTIYQHALMGTRDPSWTDNEAEAFSVYLNRIARVLVQGKGIAETFAHAFQINRSIDVVFTMAPDEVGGRWTVDGGRWEVARSEKGGGTAGPTSYVYGSLSTVHCQLSARRSLRFGILCRFTEQKGIVYILEALRMFRERHGAVDFTFAGQGPMESSIRSTVDSWESEPQQPHCERTRAFGVRQFDTAAFLSAGQSEGKAADTDCRTPKDGAGAPSREADISPLVHAEVRIVPVSSAVDILTNLDVFVHPGLDDAMPVSIVEALMCGVPCIVSDVGASPELVRDGVEGRVIQPASSEAILLAMEWFQERTVDELNVLRRQARRRYEDCCAPEIIGGQVAEIYRDVMGEGGEREM
jgi:glycosyltransferase involved in cell wall biosynthesis